MVFTAYRKCEEGLYEQTETGQIYKKSREYKSEFETKLVFGDHCFVIYKNWRGKYAVKECIVDSICFTNTWCYRMLNGHLYHVSLLGKTIFCHNELQEAIDACMKANQKQKVKVKYLPEPW